MVVSRISATASGVAIRVLLLSGCFVFLPLTGVFRHLKDAHFKPGYFLSRSFSLAITFNA
ncbi:hypothetical protein BC831DRAFT_494865 [Entophlyctis helioformis]|nr:hypothetical protein BC831DRAFT_494865 [Entophlyctis helioformis]